MKPYSAAGRAGSRLGFWLLAGLAVCAGGRVASADALTFSGTITQSTQDGTGPAVNNPSLNHILDGDSYAVTLNLPGALLATGTYNLTGGMLAFSDPAAGASETSFGSLSLTVSANGAFDDFFLLGCLTTGGGCSTGNQLALAFQTAAGSLNAQNVAAQGLPGLLPLDLLEDDGTTDIQGSVTGYSYLAATPVPEPSPAFLIGFVALTLVGRTCWRAGRSKEEKRA